jgi:hypothetical protein
MKSILITGVSAVRLLCSIGSAANAAPVATYDVTCGASILLVGAYSRDRDVNVTVVYDRGAWRIVHTLSNGHVYERGVQYDLADTSNASNLMWTGTLRRNPAISMNAWLETGRNGQPVYMETMYKGGQIVMQSRANCSFDSEPSAAPTYEPPVVAQTPAPAPAAYNPGGGVGGSNGDAVPFIMVGNAIHVTVTIGGVPNDMLLDTGAAMSSVTTSLADGLIARGEAHELAPAKFTMANGSSEYERVISVNSITIGSHTRTNVSMSVGPDGSMMLLGLPVLNAIGKFTIDAGSSQLIFG